jgi:glycosyltransferase involved in cell wall biosynthesis
MAPQISIITPCLNQAPFLARTLASVAAQRGVALEHIVFDPGSLDASREIIRAANVRGFFERDAGIADAINKGMAAARGDIVGWLGGDDLYPSDGVLAQVVAAFAAHPDADVIYTRSINVDETGAQIADPGLFEVDGARAQESLEFGDVCASGAAFFRRSIVQRVGGLDAEAGLAYAFDYLVRIAKSGARFMALDIVGLHKRCHRESVSRLLGGARAMACARVTRNEFGKASPAWIGKAVDADVATPRLGAAQTREEAISNVCAGIERRFNRDVRAPDFLALLGNGPSLKGFDFDMLRDVDALGMNAAYRHWRTIGWYPRYYACLDDVLGFSHRGAVDEMVLNAERLGIDLFFLCADLVRALSPAARGSVRVVDFDAVGGEGGLLDCHPWTTGSHAALFAALLGYRMIYVLGVDCNYVERVDGAEARQNTVLELARTPTENPNYFFDGYQLAGDRYNVPNPIPDLHLNCWRDVGARLAARDITVWNGSAVSRVDVFPRLGFAQARSVAVASAAAR